MTKGGLRIWWTLTDGLGHALIRLKIRSPRGGMGLNPFLGTRFRFTIPPFVKLARGAQLQMVTNLSPPTSK